MVAGNGNGTPETITLAITINVRTRHVDIQGPLDDSMLCDGLLEAARKILGRRWLAANPLPSVMPKSKIALPFGPV